MPLLASGGLMTPQDVQAVLQAGAVAAQCGTPFLLVHEASTSAP
ncbi:nitronate monooxygenase [Deinococcus radiophilus]|nr:nitronate monooxygenase [Deinococcus radiophilus]